MKYKIIKVLETFPYNGKMLSICLVSDGNNYFHYVVKNDKEEEPKEFLVRVDYLYLFANDVDRTMIRLSDVVIKKNDKRTGFSIDCLDIVTKDLGPYFIKYGSNND